MEDPITSLPDGKGDHTSNYAEMHSLTYDDWAKILFRDDIPDLFACRERYWPYLPKQPRNGRSRLPGETFQRPPARCPATGATRPHSQRRRGD